MKALVNRGEGGQAVDLADVPEPDPGPNEAVIAVAAAAINRGELRLLAMRDKKWRPGQDVAGTIVKPAEDGTGPTGGTRVVAWPEQAGWAERVAVPTTHLASLSDDVTFSQAATLPIAGVTALRALRLGGDLSGRRVLVTGASGGVGRFAVELAANAGASVSGVSRNERRSEGLASLGADAVFETTEESTGLFDLILESAGGGSLEASIQHVAPGGTIVVFGNSAGQPSEISFANFRGHPGSKIEAFFVYESGEPPTYGEDLRLLADLIAAGELHPQIGLELPWTEANAAFIALSNREVNGKAVLLVG